MLRMNFCEFIFLLIWGFIAILEILSSFGNHPKQNWSCTLQPPKAATKLHILASKVPIFGRNRFLTPKMPF